MLKETFFFPVYDLVSSFSISLKRLKPTVKELFTIHMIADYRIGYTPSSYFYWFHLKESNPL